MWATAQRTNTPASMPARSAVTVTAHPPPPPPKTYKRSKECNRNFKNEWCFKNHRANKVCERLLQCEICQTLCSKGQLKEQGKEHICGQRLCKICRCFVNPGHKCHKQQKDPFRLRDQHDEQEGVEEGANELLKDELPKNTKYVFFDFECTEDTGKHIPNY